MSRAALMQLRDAHALPHTLRYDSLAPYHVPFDELNGNGAIEAQLAHWIERRGRIALIGSSGSGKSSALAWALAHHAPESLAALRIPIALADDETVQTAAGFARHVVRRVIVSARLAEQQAGELRVRAADAVRSRGRERQRGRRLALRGGIVNGELTRELTDATDEFEEQIGAGEVVEGLQQLVALFRARDTEPLLVLEDTDTWIARPNDDRPAALADAFFGRNVRMLATELDCGFVVAVHPSYLALPAYRAVQSRLEPVRVLPIAEPQDGLSRILARRIEVAQLSVAIGEVFEPEALGALATLHAEAPDLRRTIGIAATAVRLALEEPDLECVTVAAVRAAAAERLDGSPRSLGQTSGGSLYLCSHS